MVRKRRVLKLYEMVLDRTACGREVSVGLFPNIEVRIVEFRRGTVNKDSKSTGGPAREVPYSLGKRRYEESPIISVSRMDPWVFIALI